MSSFAERSARLREDISTYVLWLSALLAIDQATKFWVRSHMSLGEFRTLIPGILDLRYVENTGIAFGLLQGLGIWLAPIAVLVALIATIGYFKASPQDRSFRSAMILVSAGALGNFLDRAFLNGRVTDFIDLQIIHVFNLADVSISSAVAILLVRGILEEIRSFRQKASSPTSPSPQNPTGEPAQQENPIETPASSSDSQPQAEETSHPAP